MKAPAVTVRDGLSQGVDTTPARRIRTLLFATNALPKFVKETILMGQFTLACVIYAKMPLFHCCTLTAVDHRRTECLTQLIRAVARPNSFAAILKSRLFCSETLP